MSYLVTLLKKSGGKLVVVALLLTLAIVVVFWDAWPTSPSELPWWHWTVPEDARPKECMPDTYETYRRRGTLDEVVNTGPKIISTDQDNLFDVYENFVLPSNFCGGDCEVTFDASYQDEVDAVLYHCLDLQNDRFTNFNRSHPSQLFIFFCLENPWTTKFTRNERIDLGETLDGVFNLTMSYRTNSDIYCPYSNVDVVFEALDRENEILNFDGLLRAKVGHTAWVVSDCGNTKGALHRMTMVSQLVSAGLRLDRFGRCFRSFDGPVKQLIARYKFYIAFENAFHCREYITEKLWSNALEAGAVPVVWGACRTEVKRVLPPGSYIFVEDFGSPRDLVEYLNFLDGNAEEYQKFFRWRFARRGKPSKPKYMNDLVPRVFCEICKTLHSRSSEGPSVVQSVENWWYGQEHETCLAPSQRADFNRYWISHMRLQPKYMTISIALSVIVVIFITLYVIHTARAKKCFFRLSNKRSLKAHE